MGKPLFVTTFPKTGTHLLWHILGLVKDESDSVTLKYYTGGSIEFQRVIGVRIFPNGIGGHIPYSKEALELSDGMKKFTLVRDPRDAIVSLSHYYEDPENDFKFGRLWGIPDFRTAYDRLMLIIEVIREFWYQYLPWIKVKGINILRYENLLFDPHKELAPYAYLAPLETLVERARFRGTDTFRKGIPGEWTKEFKPRHIKRFNQLYGDIMEAWGYE